ncbi:MAG: Serine/threonine-protein kinase [Piccolia ochrophora]|nr:MAG: Serine/threonine-protein kinase [Piccolia ochrophora]
MGQGFSLTTLSAGSAGIDVPELADLSYERSLGTARFMKSIRARHRDGLAFVKVVVKPYPSMKLEPYVREILRERSALINVPNALSYERILETATNGYLVRQYFNGSLYDRMSTRPFLEDIEKKWLSFQLLSAIRDSHANDVFHGDIKTENILVTSWNWLYLADFSSSFKPTFLPEDNPADFSYYFDTSGRRTCYLAPERFLVAGELGGKKGKVDGAMDVFSVGCVIAELFVESPIFSLSQLYKYRKGEYDPAHAHLSRIEDKEIRDLVAHMIQVQPESRYSADEYLNFWRRKAFPEYFYSFLHQYMGLITDPSSGRAPTAADATSFGEADDRIDKIYFDFDKISYFLGYEHPRSLADNSSTDPLFGNSVIPVHVNVPHDQHEISAASRRSSDDGTLIFLTLIVSSLRNTARATARIRACDILLCFAERVTDEAKLDRILPYVMNLLNDDDDTVKIAALRTLTQLMALVRVLSPVNAYIFPEYILPRLQPFIPTLTSKPRPTVRATYASCLATLANTSSRFLDMTQALRADGSLPTADPEAEDATVPRSAYQTLFDVARNDLLEHFETHAKALLTDSESSVRRAFLGSISSLCVFFGTSKANDVILSHLNTYLNDKDWMLRCAFFETIVGVATFVGGTSLEEFILPLMVQALTDPEELVVEKVIRSFASMADLGLFQRSTTWSLVEVVSRFTMHPNTWIREAATSFIVAATRHLSEADNYCIIAPLIKPYLKTSNAKFEESKLLNELERPLSRVVFEMACSWVTKVDRGIFWKPAQQQRTFTFGAENDSIPTKSIKDEGPLSRVPKNDEDEQWLVRLRNIGMGTEDEWKLLALREYLWRMAPLKPREGTGNMSSYLNSVVNLKQLQITPQTVFFNEKVQFAETHPQNTGAEGPHTIADALLDASTSFDDSLTRRRKSTRTPSRLEDSERITSSALPYSPLDSTRNSSPSPSHSSSLPKDISQRQHPSKASLDPGAKAKNDLLSHLPVNGTGTTSSEVDSLSDADPRSHHHRVRHKKSAVNLLNRNDSAKALAETSTTSTNVSGKVGGPYIKKSRPVSPLRTGDDSEGPALPIRFRAGHTYEGNDPSVLKLLDNLYHDNYPVDTFEFGPLVTPVTRRQHIKRSSGTISDAPWHPDGTLVAVLSEHAGPINRVVVAPDHAFFITGSDDGTVKVWDSTRLERNVAYRSRQTHKHGSNVKVKSLCFVENTHCFVSGASDGSVQVVKVDCSRSSGSTRYSKIRQLKEYHLHEGEVALWLEHYRSDIHSVLMIATNRARILALDLRSMNLLYTLQNPVHFGTPTCFCIDKKRNWLLVATSHGLLTLWDLRFRVRLKSWGLPGASPIHRLSIHPLKGRGKWVCVAGGSGQGEITVWDIEKLQCREAYRASTGKDVFKGYEPWRVDEERPEGMLGRFATALEPSGHGSVDRGFRAFTVGVDVPEDGRDSRYAFLITGGCDRKIRFWDVTRVDNSMVVSGLDSEEAKPTFVSSNPTPTLTLNTERVPQRGPTSPNAGAAARTPSNTAARRGSGRPPRSTVISLQQQQLLKSHLDSILDVALLELPYGMIISVDRSGVIFTALQHPLSPPASDYDSERFCEKTQLTAEMRLTVELLQSSLSYLNPLKERELDLRGHRIPAIENLGAAKDQDAIDLTDNDITSLSNFPLSPRLHTLLLARNRVSNIQPSLASSIPHLTTLVLTANNVGELADLDPLSALPKLTHLVLMENPVARKEHYRHYLIWRLPTVRFLDYQRVRDAEREKGASLFGTATEPTSLATKISATRSRPSTTSTTAAGLSTTPGSSGLNGDAAPGKQYRVQLTPKEKKRVEEMIRNAKSLQEITRLERELNEGRVPGGFVGGAGGEAMEE